MRYPHAQGPAQVAQSSSQSSSLSSPTLETPAVPKPSCGPTILTARALRRDHPVLVATLQEAGCTFSWVSQWASLLHAEDLPASGLVVVDLDAANRAAVAPSVPSGYRLTKLLARSTRERSALVVLTHLDYVEIEDLVLAGVRALVDPRLGAQECAARILATATRQAPSRHERLPVEVGSLVGAPMSGTSSSHAMA